MEKLRLFQLALLAMVCLPLSAQERVYSNFLHEGKTWRLQQVVAYATSEVTVTVAGDILAGGKSCKQLVCDDGGEKTLFAVMVEEGEKVYEAARTDGYDEILAGLKKALDTAMAD